MPFTKNDPNINRKGRPKGAVSIVDGIRRKLRKVPEGKEKTYLHYFIEKLFQKAIIEGDTQTMRDIINRVDGMPKQSIDLDGSINQETMIALEKETAEILNTLKGNVPKRGNSKSSKK